MVDFKTALESLGSGKLSLRRIRRQINKLLDSSPPEARHLLGELESARAKNILDGRQYSILKKQIEDFIASHPEEVNEGFYPNDATVVAGEQPDMEVNPTVIGSGSSPEDIREMTQPEGGVRDDATIPREQAEEREIPDDAEDTTMLKDAPDGDKTEALSDSGDRTEALSDSGGMPVDFDFSSPNAFSVDGANTPDSSDLSGDISGTDMTGPAAAEGDLSGGYGEGSIIKQRFRLEKVLGIGGMGKVYKAIDLLKEEARDKKPYVAVKLLNDDFKGHPEAFIALQREASRQQKLAHPNIATIYDFDRVGGRGTPVFITMELMEGMELKDFIRKKVKPQGGMPFAKAYDLIQQLGAGLIYAHDRSLVHSDFKPGNAFLCNDGTVKTLDFGIARAVKNPVTGEKEKTLFDPGKLGALTPAYASLEMLEGSEPDTRDDTYALGCTAYELLTGKHPFNKLPANKAEQNHLKPPYIKNLNKKQNRALRRAVAFHRKDRSPSVAHFVEELAGKPTWHKNPLTIAAAILLVVAGILFNPAMDYLHEQELQQLITTINQSAPETIPGHLTRIRELPLEEDKNTVTREAQAVLQRHLGNKVTALLSDDTHAFNYRQTDNIILEIAEFYPESIFLQEQRERITEHKRKLISDYNHEYVAMLRDTERIGGIRGILDKLANVDPQHPLLSDPRPATAYRLLAYEAYERGELDEALTLAQSGLETAPDDVRLHDLQNIVNRAKQVTELEQSLAWVQSQLTSLEAIQQQINIIQSLSGLKLDSPQLQQLADTTQPLIREQIQQMLTEGERQDAEALSNAYGPLLRALGLYREATQIKLAHLGEAERTQLIQQLTEENFAALETGLRQPELGNMDWEYNLLAAIRELRILTADSPEPLGRFDSLVSDVSQLFIDQANLVLEDKRFDIADNLVQRAQLFAPELDMVKEALVAVADARAEDARQERVRSYKTDIKAFADGDNISDAVATLQKLQEELPENDIYLTTEAIPLVVGSFTRVARSRAEAKDFESALTLARRGYELEPTNDLIKSMGDEYQAEVNISGLLTLFRDNTVDTIPGDARVKVNQIKDHAAAGRFAEFSKEAISLLRNKVQTLRKRNENAAAVVARISAEMFPSSTDLAKLRSDLQLKPWDQYSTANALTSVGKLTEAQALLEREREKFSGHPQYEIFAKTLENKLAEVQNFYNMYLEDKETAEGDYVKLSATEALLSRAQKLWTDNPDYKEERTALKKLIVSLKPARKPTIRQAEKFDASSLASTVAQTVEWTPVPSVAECTTRLAGYGRRAKAVCYDVIHRQGARGPDLIVVPAGEGMEKSFAIGKYEISRGDWTKYCIISGNCTAETNKERRHEPQTGISLAEAQQYAEWLSERTGKTYRLPSREEWEYASLSQGKQPYKDYNCRVAIGDKIIKGTGIISVKSGRSNAWGIKNHVGNVQEWVVDNGSNTVEARGGSFQDPHSKCEISLSREHDGGADDITGFRILREEVFDQSELS